MAQRAVRALPTLRSWRAASSAKQACVQVKWVVVSTRAALIVQDIMPNHTTKTLSKALPPSLPATAIIVSHAAPCRRRHPLRGGHRDARSARREDPPLPPPCPPRRRASLALLLVAVRGHFLRLAQVPSTEAEPVDLATKVGMRKEGREGGREGGSEGGTYTRKGARSLPLFL